MQELILLPLDEFKRRIESLRPMMLAENIDAILITDNANTYYLTGRVFAGYIYIPLDENRPPQFFIRRPIGLCGDNIHYIRKPEDIASIIGNDCSLERIGLELDVTPYSTIERLRKVFTSSAIVNASSLMRKSRSIKTDYEIEQLRLSAAKQSAVYNRIPEIYRPGMTDLQLQIELERTLRLEGCLGQFRISGDSMELFMGNILVGDNADNPSPYDFAMGGAGLDPSIPAGCNGTKILPGLSVMVDINGNFTGYMTDMTRTFVLGSVSELAQKAHDCSIAICAHLASIGRPGVEARELYDTALRMADEAGLKDYFMGHRQKAGFIGHGVGIEINELPVIAPRSRDILANGNVIALEPKFVIPGTGAVGIENTYIVTPSGMQCITNAPEQIIQFAE